MTTDNATIVYKSISPFMLPPKYYHGNGKPTPWGCADCVYDLGEGVKSYSTPSHGGIYVPKPVWSKWPEPLRTYMADSPNSGWLEEDCEWAVCCLAMPHLFTAEQHMACRSTIAQWMPNLWNQILAGDTD